MSDLSSPSPSPLPPQSSNSSHASDSSYLFQEGTPSSSGWRTEAEDEDSDRDEVESFAEEGCADEDYWEEDAAMDAWLARFMVGRTVLYPRLFFVKPRQGEVQLPSRSPNNNTLLQLPPEIRNRIYQHYFHSEEVVKNTKESLAPFQDREGAEMQRLFLSSENVELKFWLSSALLQTSRQLRFEAMFILFGNRVITVEWLPALPRFVEFLGKEGCSMLRYLDIWDFLNLQGSNTAAYRDVITSIGHFPNLQHLRIVVSWDVSSVLLWVAGEWGDRVRSWFNQNEWKSNGKLTTDAVPKIRSEDIEKHWPEYEVLTSLKAHKFTLAMEIPWGQRYIEFDRSKGVFPQISNQMQTNSARTDSAPLLADLIASPGSPQGLEAFETTKIRPDRGALAPNIDVYVEDFGSPTWQETDDLVNKTIPFYNFIRDFFHKNPPAGRSQILLDNFATFPTAKKSTGSVIQDCAFCYIHKRHCGHHNIPDQPPFEPISLESDDKKVDLDILQAQFRDMSYVEMREVCRDIVVWMEDADNLVNSMPVWDADVVEFLSIATIFDYLGWPKMPSSERLAMLDAVVEFDWTGKRVDKDETPPWDMLFREIYSSYSHRHPFRVET